MTIEVVVFADKSTELLSRWRVSENSDLSLEPWEELALHLVRRARLGSNGAAEVFFCMRDQELASSDYSFIEALVEAAHEHTWGARLYIVIEPYGGALDYSLDTCKSLCKGLAVFLRSRVDDVLECRINLTDKDSFARPLRLAADRSRARESLMRYPLKVAEAGEGIYGFRILLPLLEPFRFRPGHSDLAVIICHPHEKLQRDLVEQLVLKHEVERVTVISLQYEAKEALQKYCNEENFNLLEIRGPIELRYFLSRAAEITSVAQREIFCSKQPREREDSADWDIYADYESGLARLSHHIGAGLKDLLPLEQRLKENLWRSRRYGDTLDLSHSRSEIIDHLSALSLRTLRLDFNTLCRVEPAAPPPAFLVTNSFDPESEREQCLLAARLLDLIRQEAPPGSSFLTHLAVACQPLCDMIKVMESVNTWIFMGPADGPRGLQEASPPHCVKPEIWR
jgi:hypothetical protein